MPNNYLVPMLCAQMGLPQPEAEYRFHPVRRWLFDFAWPAHGKVALEVEGGTWLQGGGRHNRAAGYAKDCEKYNSAALLGWRVFRATPEMVPAVVAQIKEALR
jgi:hypothetical protein